MPVKKRIIVVAGARPNFMKIAPLFKELKKVPHFELTLVHTGQHYDEKLSKVFFDELKIPKPDINLEVGSGNHAQQTAAILEKFDAVLEKCEQSKKSTDLVVVVGDVNSTVACGLACTKRGIKIAHVEAGLRSFDWSMPEEVNRVLTDHMSVLLFCTEDSGVENLLNEGIPLKRIHFVGNVMIDTLLANKKIAQTKSTIIKELFGIQKGKTTTPKFAIATLHRASNVDEREQLNELIKTLQKVSEKIPVIFPLHPRTAKKISELKIDTDGIKIIEPLGYLDFLQLMSNATLVLTDSGGIQEETTALGIPCLTLRNNTERPITITNGTNKLVGTDQKAIIKGVDEVLNHSKNKQKSRPKFWDGKAAERIVRIILKNI